MELKGKPRWEAIKTIFWGLLLSAAFFAFWLSLFGSPYAEYVLMANGRIAEAKINACVQDFAESDTGQGGPFQDCTYSFQVGTQIYGGRDAFPNETYDGEVFKVTYDPRNPETHKTDSSVASGLIDFIFRKVILGGVLLIMFVAPGMTMVWSGVKAFYHNEVVK